MDRSTVGVLLTLALLGAACNTGGEPARTAKVSTGPAVKPGPVAQSSAQPKRKPTSEGASKMAQTKQITVIGTAERAKLGALVISQRRSFYCLNIGEWPDHVVGKKVKVTGTIQVTDRFKARVDKSGAISQGTRGGDSVMHDATYEVLPD